MRCRRLSIFALLALLVIPLSGPTAVAAPVPTYSSVVLADAPRAFWRLGEDWGASTASDASGGGFHGTYGPKVEVGEAVGALLYDENGAGAFVGTESDLLGDDDVAVPDNDALDFGLGDFSVEAWVTTTTNADRPIIGKISGSGGAGWLVVVTDDPGMAGRVRAEIHDGLPEPVERTVYGPSIRVDDGAWHHVVVAFDRDTGISVYVDRIARTALGVTAGSVSNSIPLRLGGSAGRPSFDGDIDEVAVYPHVLSGSRVRLHYDAAVEPPEPYFDEGSADAPTGYWRLGESPTVPRPGGTAVDASGNGYNGTYGTTPSPGVPGALVGDPDTAVGFSGVDGITVPDTDALDFATADFTAEAWIKTSSADNRAFVGKGNPGLEPGWGLAVTSDAGHLGEVRATVFDGVLRITAYSGKRVDDGTWHHVVAALDRDAGIFLYVDAQEVMTAGIVLGSIANAWPLRIGEGAGALPFIGQIDELALYEYAAAPDRVAIHYQAGAAPSERTRQVEGSEPPLEWTVSEFSRHPGGRR